MIKISDIVILSTQRELRRQKVEYIAAKMRSQGYNTSYPITLQSDGKTLVDGGHRLAAAELVGIDALPYLALPDGADPIAHAIRANQDGADTEPHDVFDLAELCYNLSTAGMTGAEIGERLGWSETAVTFHKNIKDQLCSTAWVLSRGIYKNDDIVNNEDGDVVNSEFTIVNWKESHFRAFLKHLPYDNTRATMRAQVQAINELVGAEKITAKSAEAIAQKYAWQTELKRKIRDGLVPEVSLTERKKLIKSIASGVFGKEPITDNVDKFDKALTALNEDVLKVKLYKDDALQRIPLLADGSVSLVVTDPPYNVTEHTWDKIGTDDEFLAWTKEWLEVTRPKLAQNYHLFVFCDSQYQARIETLLLDNGWPLKSRIVWEYRNLVKGRDVKDKFICNWQMIFHCGTHALNWPQDWDDRRFAVQTHATPQTNFNEGKVHPTQKPESLIRLFVKLGSAPGDIVLDMFAGGGTTGAACISVGQRQCVLIEQEEQFCQAIEKRLKVSRE